MTEKFQNFHTVFLLLFPDNDETKENEEEEEEMSIDGENAVAESTRIDSVLATQDSNTASSQTSESQPSQPPNKKLKIKMGFNKV